MVAVAMFFFCRARKLEKERTVSFSATSDGKKRYKDGVEVKPSGSAKSNTNINDSTVQEELLDGEEEDK